ncbi:MAG TPA: hypothetical protein VGO29_07240 [Solirubrobacteraceae bacterium]|jgi:hypothetical protein|nr:hypothetical protein [Solirubrobacteraceae bacterium]
MVEHCFHCLSAAPSGDVQDAEDWLMLVTRDGEYLGVACSGCIADEDLALIELEALHELAA